MKSVCHSAETVVTKPKGNDNCLYFCRNKCHNGQMRSASYKNVPTASEAISTIRQTLKHELPGNFGTKLETKAITRQQASMQTLLVILYSTARLLVKAIWHATATCCDCQNNLRQQALRFNESDAACTLAAQGLSYKYFDKPDLPCKAEMYVSSGVTERIILWDNKLLKSG